MPAKRRREPAKNESNRLANERESTDEAENVWDYGYSGTHVQQSERCLHIFYILDGLEQRFKATDKAAQIGLN